MLFTLTGRDELSDVFDDIGDAARRLHRRISAATTEADRDLRRLGSTTSRTLAGMRRDSDAGAKAVEQLGKVTKMLWPAAIPAAASLVPIAAGAATVAVAVGAMGVAMGAQIKAMGEASEAQKAYEDAVGKSGATSQEAVQAQAEYARIVAQMPPATREAAAAVGVLKDNYKDWSDSLAADTMAPFTKGVGLVNALLPKTTGLVKVAAGETDRFVTIVGGAMASPGLDRLNNTFTTFAEKTLRKVNDEIVHLMRVSDSGEVAGPAREFMTWARAQGPTVASVLSSVATAMVHVLEAGSDVGVGLLQVVEVLARLVSAVPPGAIALFLQLALALKLTKAAALGMAAARTALAGFGVSLVAVNTAASAAPGRLAAVRAAIGALSKTTKIAMAGTGIGLLVIALSELSQRGKQAPPDVDKLTSSLKQLGSTGKVTGEAAKHFGSDLSGLHDKVRALTDPTTTDKVQQFLVGWTGWDSTPVKEAKENIDAVDKSLADLVSSGQSDLAAAALKRLTAEYGKGGRDTKEFTSQLDDYKRAIADAKFEAQLAADAQGLFGAQAMSVQEKLNGQKLSADGLRQSIQALNDVQREGLGGMIGFEAAIDAAAKAAKDNAGALTMSHGALDLNSEKARNAAGALQDLAGKTDAAASSARESGSSWETVNGIYSRGRSELIKSAQAMGLTRDQAAQLADQILKTPDKKVRLDMAAEDARRDLAAFNAAVKRSPDSKSVTLKTLSKSAEQILEGFGLKVRRLPDGSVTVSAKAGQALSGVKGVKAAIDSLYSKSITIFTKKTTRYITEYQTKYLSGRSQHDITGATGGLFTGSDFRHRGYAAGGLVDGPGTGTSDSVFAPWLSAGEFVVNAARTKQWLPLLKALNSGRLGLGSLRGDAGTTGAGLDAGRGLASGLTSATPLVQDAAMAMAAAITAGIKEEMQIASPSKKTKALAADIGKGLIVGLTGTQAKIKSVAADLVKDIKTAFSGKKESQLIAFVNRQTKHLLDVAKKRDKIAATIAAAKQYAADTTKAARENAGLSNLGIEDGKITAGSIKAGLAAKLSQLKQFTTYIGQLAKKGLNRGLLRQIINMGPEQGYAYASALMGADKATLASINSLDTQIGQSADSLGKTGADALYDSGKNASKGFLSGLTSQQKELEKTMEKIAKAMQKALKKALGIKSPARAMIPDGINTVRGVAAGLIEGLPHVDRAMQAVAGRIAGKAASGPTAGRAAVTAAGGGVVYQVNVTVEAAMDPIAVGRELQRVMLQLGRAQGAKVSLNLGGM
jgi:chorismate mutase/polyhydroxyalkanoate synthesis regulator phasin